MKLSPLAFLVAFSLAPCLAAEPSAAAKLFGALPLVRDVHLSPDGNYLALQSGAEGQERFVIMDIAGKDVRQIPALGENSTMVQTVEANWIAWKGVTTLVAGVLACRESADSDKLAATSGYVVDREGEGHIHPIHLEKVWGRQIQIQFGDRLLSFLPDDPRHVLVEARVQDELYPDVMKVDVETGLGETVVRARTGFTDWMADGAGAVRLAVAFPHRDLRRIISVRGGPDEAWRPIHEDQVGTDPAFVPLAFSRRNSDLLFVETEENAHLVIRQFDTATLSMGEVVAADPGADVVPVLRAGELIGYRLGNAPVVYLDEGWRHLAEVIRKALPGAEIELVDRSTDGRRALVRVTDEAQPSVYYLLDKRADGTHLDPLGATRDERLAAYSAPVVPVSYQAQDGTLVPAFVTLPPGPRRGPIPFVVLAHDGPGSRDGGGFDYLVQFLVNQGYGVFQPQFRGSSTPLGTLGGGLRMAGLRAEEAPAVHNTVTSAMLGSAPTRQAMAGSSSNKFFNTVGDPFTYERDFGVMPNASAQLMRVSGPEGVDMMLGPKLEAIVDRHYAGLSNGAAPAYVRAGYGGWGRSIQDDITDGVHWLVDQGYADPDRVCIAGAGFGGYAALMGAVRDSSLYRCAAAVAPVTDLKRLDTETRRYLDGNYLQGYLHANSGELGDISPFEQADRIDIPVLLVHGREDCDVPVSQTEEMEAALRRPREKIGSVQVSDVPARATASPDAAHAPRPPRSVTVVYLDTADHELSRASDRVAYLAALEEFLAANLKSGS